MRRDQTLTVSDGTLNALGAGRRRLPDRQQRQEPRPAAGSGGPVDDHHQGQLQGPRAVPAGRPAGLRRRRQLHQVRPRRDQRARPRRTPEKFEFINEVAGTPRNAAADATANLAAGFPNDFYLRVKSDGTNITGEYSTDGTTWTAVGQQRGPAGERQDRRVRAVQRGGHQRDGRRSTGSRSRARASCSRSRTPVTRSPATGSTRRAGTRSSARTPRATRSQNGGLTATTVLGDIYTNSDATITRNFFLQTADHAGADYVLETKVTGTYAGGYARAASSSTATTTTTSSSTRSPTSGPDAGQPHRAALGGRPGRS